MIALPDDFFDLLCLKQMAACLLLYWLPKHNSWEFIRQPLACLKVCNLLFFCVCKVWWVVAMTICQQLFHHGNRSWNQLSPTYFAKSYLCRWEYCMDILWSSKLQKEEKNTQLQADNLLCKAISSMVSFYFYSPVGIFQMESDKHELLSCQDQET